MEEYTNMLPNVDTIVFSKRLDSRGFHDLFNEYIFFFSKHYGYCKTGAIMNEDSMFMSIGDIKSA